MKKNTNKSCQVWFTIKLFLDFVDFCDFVKKKFESKFGSLENETRLYKVPHFEKSNFKMRVFKMGFPVVSGLSCQGTTARAQPRGTPGNLDVAHRTQFFSIPLAVHSWGGHRCQKNKKNPQKNSNFWVLGATMKFKGSKKPKTSQKQPNFIKNAHFWEVFCF